MNSGIMQIILRQKLLVMLGSVMLLIAGFLAWKQLPVDAFPDVTNVQVMILTKTPGLAPGEVERLVTLPIELEMGGLPDVQEVRSLSKTGLSQVIVIFEDHVDTYFSRQLVFERLAAVKDNLPNGVAPELGPISTGLGEIYQYALQAGFSCPEHDQVWRRSAGVCSECGNPLTSSQITPMQLRTLQNWLISPQLRRLAGVNEVNSFGGYVKQFHVMPQPEKLLKYGITLQHVVDAVAANNANVGGSFIEQDWEQINVIADGLIANVNDLELIVLKAQSGTPVYLRDVAEISIGHQTRYGAVTQDGEGEVVIGMVIMLKGANSKLVVDRVKAEIPRIQKTLPPGVKIVPFYDRTDLIEACVRTVSTALMQGGVFVIIVLVLFLWNLRTAGVVALSLPLTMAVAFLLMGWQGMTANLMSLGGLVIAIGLVVDGAIIVVENIARHMSEQADSDMSRSEIALRATREVARPVIFGILIILIVFLPLFSLQSMEGKMFKPLALTMCFALLGSLLVSLVIMPVFAALFTPRRRQDSRGNLLANKIHALHMPILKLAMKGRWITVAVAAALFVGTAAIVPKLGTEFLPPLNEGALAINIMRLSTANVEGSKRQALEIEKLLLAKFPEVTTVVSKTGRAEIAEDPMGPEQSDVFVMLKPQSQWHTGRSKAQLITDIDQELQKIPGIRLAFSQPIALRVNELISGIKSDVAIKVFGDDMEVLVRTVEQIAPLLAEIEGVQDLKIEQVSGFSQLEVQMDRQAMARHRINVADINNLVETAIGGKAAGIVYEGQKRFEVQVRYPQQYRNSAAALAQLLVPSPLGYQVPLGDLAAIEVVNVPAQISRENAMRRMIVECNVRGRDMGGFVKEAQAKLASVERELPHGYWLTWGGQFENQRRAMARLRTITPVALLLIFVMLYSALGSLKSAMLILVNLPFALIGGVLAIYLLGFNLSVAASIGFIALLGCAVEDGIVLISFCEQLRKDGMNVRAAVFEACRLRIRPLIMTTLTTVLGLLPMLYATGAGSEIQKPLVAVVFGGLLSSLALELVVLPVLYALVNGMEAEETVVAQVETAGLAEPIAIRL